MSEGEGKDNNFRHYTPLLRRIAILAAVLAAIPVILWTITVFMRSYVGPPQLPTFRQLAASPTVKGSRNAGVDTAGQPPPASVQSRLSDTSPATLTTGTTPTNVPDKSVATAALKGALAGDAPTGAPDTPTVAPKTAATSPSVAADPKAPEAPAAAPSNAAAPSTGAVVAQQPAVSIASPADAEPAAAPLSGPIPLPPRRPHLIAMAQMTPASVPMPRPRPGTAGAAASDGTTAGPFDWLQNMFRKNGE